MASACASDLPASLVVEQNNNNHRETSSSSSSAAAAAGTAPPEMQPSEKAASASNLGNTRSGRSSLSSSNSGDELRLLSSNADYDHIKNTTLMFFLDRLYIASKDGKEARTLHDLSCLFGKRDFTKEMRQIVGASRNGLKKFLQSYPSLFTIEGDKVYLTQLKQEAAAPVRDYHKEAVEYFKEKLQQFGTSFVPIRNLFGYRSQANQEVRHVSGKNAREFRQFLAAHDDVFEILADEHVVLKSALEELESRGESHPSLQQLASLPQEETTMDPYLNKQFAHMVEDCVRQRIGATSGASDDNANKCDEQDAKRIGIEQLHELIMKDCKNQLFLKMVKTVEDLKLFLRMHPKLFKRFKSEHNGEEREFVSLLTEEERRELELRSYPPPLMRQNSTLHRSETMESSLSDKSSTMGCGQPMSLPPQTMNTSSYQVTAGSEQPMSLICRQQQPVINRMDTSNARRSSITSAVSTKGNNQNNNNNNSNLRATAPPFVPSTYQNHRQQQQQNPAGGTRQMASRQQSIGSARSQQQPPAPLQRSQSSLTSASQRPATRPVIDPRSAIRSYLIKASAANTSNSGPYSQTKLANGAQHHLQPLQQQQSQHHGSINGEDLRARTVNIVREASNIITRIMTSVDAVAFDCKGYNLGFNGEITLIQLAFLPESSSSSSSSSPPTQQLLANKPTFHQLSNNQPHSNRGQIKTIDNNSENNKPPSRADAPLGGGAKQQKPEVCIFDLITNPELAYCLKPLLESEQIVKVIHDVRNKSNALFSQFGIMLKHVFDTQVANLVIQQQETKKPAYKSRYISMGKLCEIYGDDSLAKYRNLIKSKTRHAGGNGTSGKSKDVNYWRARPLSDAMVYESTMDVYCLVGGVYQNLRDKILPEYWQLFEQLSLEGVLARIKPEEIRNVKKERKIDLEVIDLKRKLYSDTTSTIVLSNREIRLLRHVDLTPEVRQKIQQCKKVAKKLERLDMKSAQNAQLMQQSMNSQVSSSSDAEQQSMDHHMASVQTNNSSHSSSSSSSLSGVGSTTRLDSQSITDGNTSNQQHGGESSGTQQNPTAGSPDLGDTGMTDLMDSSMFDELKDTMIESSSLLESFANEDDDDVDVEMQQHQAEHSLGSHDNCRCNCHHKSSSSTSSHGEVNENNNKQATTMSSLKSTISSSSTDQDDASVESRAVDMAVQCDLLS